MTYRGTIRDGRIELQDGPNLPDGTPVQVDIRPARGSRRARRPRRPTVGKALLKLAGSVEGLPPDASRNVDHYLYGHLRR